MHPGIERRGETFSWWDLVWLSDADTWDDTQIGVTTCTKWHTRVVVSDGILSCDCGSDEEDSSKMVIETIYQRQVNLDNGLKNLL